MADGKIEIETSINTDGVEKGLKNVNKSINAIKGAGMTAVIGAEVKALKSLVKGINDTADAYNNQLKAEKQLESASRNNPYLNNDSVKQLKAFASEMQGISTIGDEQLLPLMSQLATSGRTQAEIQTIIKTAMDVSASGMMSLDSAVTQLNASYSGNIGMLGRQISELKGLTKEELESGKAIDIVSEKFKGMSEEVASATGSYQQMKNAQGDFNEAVGRMTKPASDLWNNFWKGWYERGIENIDKLDKWLDANITGKQISEKITREMKKIADADTKSYYAEDSLDFITDSELVALDEYLKGKKTLNSEEKILASTIEYVNKHREYTNELLAEENKLEEEKRRKAEAEANRNKTAEDSYNTFLETIKNAEEEIKLRRSLGEQISKEDELQQMINVKTDAYIQLLKDADGTITGTSERELNFISSLNDEYAKLLSMQKQNEDLSGADAIIGDALSFIGQTESSTMSNAIDEEIALLDEYISKLDETSENYAKFVEKKNQLDELRKEVVKKETEEEVKKNREAVAEMVSTINDYFAQFTDITSNLTKLISQSNEEQTQKELTSLSEEYNQGLIDYEEYCNRKEEIDKESARKEYKLKLWEWTSNLLQATSNIALGITQALTQGIPLGIINGALIGTSGAIQIATLMANKPRPAYADGGIVGNQFSGATIGGDNTIASLRTGEMVLNALQQKQLWEMANGKGGAMAVNMPVTIENNASNEVNASAGISADGLRVTIDKIVNSSMQSGRYTASMNYAQSNANGVNVL